MAKFCDFINCEIVIDIISFSNQLCSSHLKDTMFQGNSHTSLAISSSPLDLINADDLILVIKTQESNEE